MVFCHLSYVDAVILGTAINCDFSWYIHYKLKSPYIPLIAKINHLHIRCTSTSPHPKYTSSQFSPVSILLLLSLSDTFSRTTTIGGHSALQRKTTSEMSKSKKSPKCSLVRTRVAAFTYRCKHCGTTLIVHFRCNSRICSNCGKNHTDKWARSHQNALFNIPHRHAVLTIPDALWRSRKKQPFSPEGLDGCCDYSDQRHNFLQTPKRKVNCGRRCRATPVFQDIVFVQLKRYSSFCGHPLLRSHTFAQPTTL